MGNKAGNKILGKFFSAGVQALSVQFLGIIFFYIISLNLSKNDFGLVSWANAVAITITTIISFGLEQVVVRRIASSSTSKWAAFAFLLHNVVLSTLVLTIFWVLNYSFKDDTRIAVLPQFFLIQSFVLIATPLKQLLNSQEKFTPYAIIAFAGNLFKVALAIIWVKWYELNLNSIVSILLGCSLFEFLALLLYIIKSGSFSLRVRFSAYKKLLKEALPQFVSVLFDSSLSRIDWILLGIMSTTVAMANYSFAYRAFEIAKLPIIIIGTVLLPRFSRMFIREKALDDNQLQFINRLFNLELAGAIFIALVLNVIWSPIVDVLTYGKYGAVNKNSFALLSACLPLHFVINLMWTICFASRKYRQVATITITTAIVNLLLNLVLIPSLNEKGAAISFLGSTVLQAFLYWLVLFRSGTKINLQQAFIVITSALILYLLSGMTSISIGWQLFIVIVGFLLVVFSQKILRSNSIQLILVNLK